MAMCLYCLHILVTMVTGYIIIYHLDTSDQREEPVYKSHIAHLNLSVRYKK